VKLHYDTGANGRDVGLRILAALDGVGRRGFGVDAWAQGLSAVGSWRVAVGAGRLQGRGLARCGRGEAAGAPGRSVSGRAWAPAGRLGVLA
jgi:hypothetical protein